MKKNIIFSTIISIFALCIFIFLAFGSSGSDGDSGKNSTIDLKASVNFTGTQFIIKNNDTFNYTNVKLEVNSQGLKNGYILKTSILKAGESFTVGAAQFTKGDGTRFNPFTIKPKNLSIWCDTPSGKKGFYFGEWN